MKCMKRKERVEEGGGRQVKAGEQILPLRKSFQRWKGEGSESHIPTFSSYSSHTKKKKKKKK